MSEDGFLLFMLTKVWLKYYLHSLPSETANMILKWLQLHVQSTIIVH